MNVGTLFQDLHTWPNYS